MTRPSNRMTIEDAQLLTAAKVAELLCVEVDTLTMWRYRRRGPVYYKMGREVRYKLSDVIKWQNRALAPVRPIS